MNLTANNNPTKKPIKTPNNIKIKFHVFNIFLKKLNLFSSLTANVVVFGKEMHPVPFVNSKPIGHSQISGLGSFLFCNKTLPPVLMHL